MEISSQIASLGEIAECLNVPIHRVEYIIRSRKIKPDLVVGGRNFYSEAQVQLIGSEIRRIDEEKGVDNAK